MLQKTYLGGAVIAGEEPSTSTHQYLGRDFVASVRSVFNEDKSVNVDFEYNPYGSLFGTPLSDNNREFASHRWGATVVGANAMIMAGFSGVLGGGTEWAVYGIATNNARGAGSSGTLAEGLGTIALGGLTGGLGGVAKGAAAGIIVDNVTNTGMSALGGGGLCPGLTDW